ncbi:MCM N-terminal domain-containing protein [Jimgerdemannia flammicorona]|uniref:MCM N-terminal domain-containing protein n=1 Tax=Jimgerdemannia flammicorona TaxID=994334 RepID=A0A433Q2R6_9FUNG|nr:MCM N-terminal domain-containing protein [Jimgerdemannia flammicorona]
MASLGWDASRIYSTNVLPPEQQENSHIEIQERFLAFIQNFRLDNNFIYRDQLRQNLMVKQYYLEVDVGHLINYNEELAQQLTNTPAVLLPLFENAVKESARRILHPNPTADRAKDIPDCQVTLRSDANMIHIRDLTVL